MQWKSLPSHISFFWFSVKTVTKSYLGPHVAICSDIPEKLLRATVNKYWPRTHNSLAKQTSTGKGFTHAPPGKAQTLRFHIFTHEWDSARNADIHKMELQDGEKCAKESSCCMCYGEASPWEMIRPHHSSDSITAITGRTLSWPSLGKLQKGPGWCPGLKHSSSQAVRYRLVAHVRIYLGTI